MVNRILVAGMSALALAAPAAFAQQASDLSRPSATATSASLPGLHGRWICASRASIEVAPVSFDTAGSAEAWVVVHRVKGEVVAAERIGKRDLEKLRRNPCDSEGGVALVG
jgi:hypothetical protein